MKSTLHKFVRRFFPYHYHVLYLLDISYGVGLENGNIPVTGFKFVCKLCGREFVDISEYGIKQLQEGKSVDDVFRWWDT